MGFKSGAQRRTPLWSLKLGPYRIISTARGERSFWVKNLLQQPGISYYIGGRRRDSEALMFAPGHASDTEALPRVFRGLAAVLDRYAQRGWAIAILMPE